MKKDQITSLNAHKTFSSIQLKARKNGRIKNDLLRPTNAHSVGIRIVGVDKKKMRKLNRPFMCKMYIVWTRSSSCVYRHFLYSFLNYVSFGEMVMSNIKHTAPSYSTARRAVIAAPVPRASSNHGSNDLQNSPELQVRRRSRDKMRTCQVSEAPDDAQRVGRGSNGGS